MKLVRWNPDDLIARSGCQQEAIASMVVAAECGESVRVLIERSKPHQILGRSESTGPSRARFREGCIKAVELRIWPLAERGRVLAEIHRRLDQLPELDRGSPAWLSGLASIYDFAGAWALAARLIRAGLKVSVVEGESVDKPIYSVSSEADVEILIAIVPMVGA